MKDTNISDKQIVKILALMKEYEARGLFSVILISQTYEDLRKEILLEALNPNKFIRWKANLDMTEVISEYRKRLREILS